MKKITNLLYVLAVLMLVSCNDFLDKSPKYAVDPETTVTDDVAVALTNACYKALQSSNLYNQRMWSLDIVAGNSLVGAGGGTDGLETIQASNFITQSDNGMALYMWRSPWVGIGQCNIVLTSLPQAEAVSESIKNRCMGEAYFLRAHYYYILARLYGGVPLRLERWIRLMSRSFRTVRMRSICFRRKRNIMKKKKDVPVRMPPLPCWRIFT